MITTVSRGPVGGAPRGRPQQGRRPAYDPASGHQWRLGLSITSQNANKLIRAGLIVSKYDTTSGKPWQTGVSFSPDVAIILIKAADTTNRSVVGLIEDLIKRLPMTATGAMDWQRLTAEHAVDLKSAAEHISATSHSETKPWSSAGRLAEASEGWIALAQEHVASVRLAATRGKFSGLISELALAMPTTPDGRPVWAPEPAKELPLTG